MFGFPQVPLATRSIFVRRLGMSLALATGLIFAALLIGIAGYHWIAGLEWIDALHNASMILGGMGPVDSLPQIWGKIFASFYALFSGLVFVGAMGLVLSPILHRMLHKFHLDDADLDEKE